MIQSSYIVDLETVTVCQIMVDNDADFQYMSFDMCKGEAILFETVAQFTDLAEDKYKQRCLNINSVFNEQQQSIVMISCWRCFVDQNFSFERLSILFLSWWIIKTMWVKRQFIYRSIDRLTSRCFLMSKWISTELMNSIARSLSMSSDYRSLKQCDFLRKMRVLWKLIVKDF